MREIVKRLPVAVADLALIDKWLARTGITTHDHPLDEDELAPLNLQKELEHFVIAPGVNLSWAITLWTPDKETTPARLCTEVRISLERFENDGRFRHVDGSPLGLLLWRNAGSVNWHFRVYDDGCTSVIDELVKKYKLHETDGPQKHGRRAHHILSTRVVGALIRECGRIAAARMSTQS